jgi:hypothetical protein
MDGEECVTYVVLFKEERLEFRFFEIFGQAGEGLF